MNNLLKKNGVVIALALIAVFFVYKRIVAPLILNNGDDIDVAIIDDDMEDDTDEILGEYQSPSNDASQELQFVSARYDIGHFSGTDLHWNEQPGRDPFTPHEQIEKSDLSAVQDKVQDVALPGIHTGRGPILPVVTAIVNSARYSYAVIDGEILAIGDRAGNFLLQSIHRNSVSLKTLTGNQSYKVMVSQ